MGDVVDEPGEVIVDEQLVRRLLGDQRGGASDVVRLEYLAHGWDNAMFRLGDDEIIRVPVRSVGAELLSNEIRWLPELAPRMSVPVPVPKFVGSPTRYYPWPWVVVDWVPGAEAARFMPGTIGGVVEGLIDAFEGLHRAAPADAPTNRYRGVALGLRADDVAQRWPYLSEHLEPDLLARLWTIWERARSAPACGGPPMWIHGDVHPRNVIVHNGKLASLIDFGDLAAGDPAVDIAIAWMIFDHDDRARFFAALRATHRYDDAVFDRAAGWCVVLLSAFAWDDPDGHFAATIGFAVAQLSDERDVGLR